MESVRVEVALTCASTHRDGRRCEAALVYKQVNETGVDPLAFARGDGWTFYRGAARCPQCGREANSFGNPD